MSDSWMAEIGTKFDRPVKFLDCMPFDGSGGKGLIEIDCAEEDMKELVEIIRNHPNVNKLDISPSPDGGVIGSVVCHNKCAACKSLMGSNCFLISASSGRTAISNGNSSRERRIRFPISSRNSRNSDARWNWSPAGGSTRRGCSLGGRRR